jgi:molybdopterin molybdotransferase
MTGAPVPKGTAKVIMIEQTCQSNGKIRVLSHAGPTHICPQGEDVRTGDIILHAPAVLGPVEIANLISAGIAQVKVAKPLRVAVLSTGNEIVDSPDRLGPGKIMNSNGPMLECLCRKFSLEVTAAGIVADNRDATVSALREALNQADIVVLSGGVSEGDFDFVTDAITQAGLRIHFNRLAVKPGKPMTFAASGQKAIFGLPGNPVAVYLMFHLFVLYAARLLAGMKSELRYFNFTLGRDFHRRQDDRTAFLPCKLTPDGTLQPVAYHGTAHLRALLDCDGFFIVPQGVKDITAGQKISYLNIKDSFE